MRSIAIIPTFNEEKNIIQLISELKKYIKDILIVDDGSTDKTLKLIRNIEKINIITNLKNHGKGNAIKKGFQFAIKKNYDLVILLDGDGQHKPSEIGKFIKKSDNYDLIIGNRMHNHYDMPLIRRFVNKIDSLIVSKIISFKVDDVHCGYRAIRTDLIKKLDLKSERFEIEAEIVLKAIKKNAKIANLNISCIYSNQKSSINPIVDTYRFIKLIINNI